MVKYDVFTVIGLYNSLITCEVLSQPVILVCMKLPRQFDNLINLTQDGLPELCPVDGIVTCWVINK